MGKIFTTSTGLQELKFISRRDAVDVIVTIIRKLDSETYSQALIATNSNGYTTVQVSWDGFKEGEQYFIEVNEAFVIAQDSLLWRGLAYCTDQTDIQNYKLIPEVRDNIIRV